MKPAGEAFCRPDALWQQTCIPGGMGLRKTFLEGEESSLSRLLLAGLAAHRADRLIEAAEIYAQILESAPGHPDALHLTGMLALRNGDLPAAQRYIRRAIQENPAVALFHQNLACTLSALGRPAEAIASYRAALKLDPAAWESMLPLAELLAQAGAWQEAIPLLEQVIALAPEQPGAYAWLGSLRKESGDLNGAIDVFTEAVERFPGDWQMHFNLAGALFEANRLTDCLESYRNAVRLRSEFADAHNCVGRVLHEFNDFDGARASYLRALELDPAHADALSNLGALMMDEGRLPEAEAVLRRALGLHPDLLNARSNLGTVLTRTGDVSGAVECFRRVLTCDPKHVAALCSMGFLHDNHGDEEGAVGYFALALEQEPQSALARFNLSSHLLAHGDFKRGWQEYERRWQVRQFYSKRKRMEQPQWRGEAIAGSRILLYSEQGFGDTLQFVRYVPMVAALGAEVILEVQPGVFNLLRNFEGASQVIAAGFCVAPIEFAWHCPLLSLPLAFATELDTIPAAVPYVQAQEEQVVAWSARIAPTGLRIGIVWSGNPEHTRDRLRSIDLAEWKGVLGVEGVTFYSLQKGAGVAQLQVIEEELRPFNLDNELRDFTDTAAVIANLDLVICVDTAVAHLAGAMGKPVWILIPPAADWRWLRGREDSPWYPTARLFRRAEGGGWAEVLDRVRIELEAMVANSGLEASQRREGLVLA
jgi:tetratricopeptide (TPR) repeat protein